MGDQVPPVREPPMTQLFDVASVIPLLGPVNVEGTIWLVAWDEDEAKTKKPLTRATVAIMLVYRKKRGLSAQSFEKKRRTSATFLKE